MEVLGCKKTFKPCGTTTIYNPSIDGPNVPALKGFAGGLYYDGSVSYVGMIFSNQCTNLLATPGRLTIDPANPGGYFVCQKDIFVNDTLKYLENHPDLTWRSATASSVEPATDIIKFSTGKSYVAFGRVVSSYTNIGRVGLDLKSLKNDYNLNFYRSCATVEHKTDSMVGIQLKMSHLNTF